MKCWPLLLLGLCLSARAGDTGKTLPPELHPPRQTGAIRIWGHPSLTDVIQIWASAYTSSHPEVRIEIHLTGSDVAMAGLYTDRADLALLGRSATSAEVQAFEWIYQYKPSRVEVLTGSLDEPGAAAALAVLANAANPLDSISLDQLDAAFSVERRRGADAAISSWAQLGLGGQWRDCPINLYSFDTDRGTGRYFREAVLEGSRNLWWYRLREFMPALEKSLNALETANQQLLNELSRDPCGLAVAIAVRDVTGVKILPLAACAGCEPVTLSRESVFSRKYPLTRAVSAYFNHPPSLPLDEVLLDFLSYALGDDGQAAAGNVGPFLPLPEEYAADQLQGLQ